MKTREQYVTSYNSITNLCVSYHNIHITWKTNYQKFGNNFDNGVEMS